MSYVFSADQHACTTGGKNSSPPDSGDRESSHKESYQGYRSWDPEAAEQNHLASKRAEAGGEYTFQAKA